MKHFANAFNVQCVYILGEISRINFYGNKHLKTMNMKTMKKYFLLFFGVYVIFIALLLLHCFYCIVVFIDLVTCHKSADGWLYLPPFLAATIFLGPLAAADAGTDDICL